MVVFMQEIMDKYSIHQDAAESHGAKVKEKKPTVTSHALVSLVFISVILLAITGLSLYIDLVRSHRQYEALAQVIGRSIFQEMIVFRRWNALHGGVYVPVTGDVQPNPYLEDPSRDMIATDGTRLTKINPEHMTRLISDLLALDNGIRVHITSLILTRPENKPDAWEREALKSFEKGSSEAFGIMGADSNTEFRYMAPLKTESTCLTCHEKQGYKTGDIRGGISIRFSFMPFQQAISETRLRIYSEHFLFTLFGLALIFFLGKNLILRISRLQEAMAHIKKLEGLLPICSSCKGIRVEGGNAKDQKAWIPVEEYIQKRTDAEFSHGLCPECLKKLYDFEYEK